MGAKGYGTKGMKSAYELALERLESQGIERPRPDAHDAATREKMAEVRSRAQARLAELEILHRDPSKRSPDPEERRKAEAAYLDERRRIEERRDRELEKLRDRSDQDT